MKCALAATIALASCCPSPKPATVATPTPPAVDAAVAALPAFDPPLPELRLPRHFMPSHVTARVAIDPAQPTFDGEVSIDGKLDKRSAVIWLHANGLTITSASAGSASLTATPHGEFLELRPAQPLEAGAVTIKLAYRGKLVENGYQGAFVSKQGSDRYVTTQFESTAARMVFPCFDEPDFKIPWQLTLDVPKDQVAVSNTPITSDTPLDATHRRVVFAQTKPLPSYLIAFGVGPYDVVDAGKAKSGLALRVFAPKGKASEAAYLASAMPRIVDILESWFAIPYPYPKLDYVIVPSARGLAMENAGMVTADARYTLLSKPAPFDEYSLVSVMGHETAHQWFGDLVTATWWDDIWLNESFATWIEDKILASYDPSWPSEVVQHRQAAFDADEIASSRKIHQPIDTPDSIHNIFDNITYPKGATVLRMLEHEVGTDKFQAAIRTYLKAHADGNATAADVFAAIEHASAGKPLGHLVTDYFDQAGVPDVAMKLTCDGGKAKLELAQSRYLPIVDPPKSDERWVVPLCIAYEDAQHKRAETCTQLTAQTGEIALDRCPAWFAPAGDYGYYRANLEPKALEAIRDKAWPLLTTPERINIFSHAIAHARTGSPAFGLLMDLAAKLRTDPSPQAFAVSLGDTWANGFAVNTGLPPFVAPLLAPDLEQLARAKVRAAVEPTARKLGLLPATNETYGAALARAGAVSAAIFGGSHVLDAEAMKALPSFRTLPTALRALVTEVAVNADPKVADQLLEQLATEPDRANRDALLHGLAAIRDLKRHRELADALLAAPTTTGEDLEIFFFTGVHDMIVANAAWVKEHIDQVLAKMPVVADDDFPIALSLVYLELDTCDAAHRDDDAAFVHSRLSNLPGAQLVIKQAIEGNDHCLAQKQLLEPSLRTWLGKSR
ncbi:MAG TPA: M1 family metallopeptidase [Kofleriaceae bacterium]|jgi:alanyl aminopeptidase|nr:M1 family metallopeptidase [Kofleriaceae bacterium]